MARREVLSRDALAPDATTNLGLWLDRYAWKLEQEDVHQHHALTLDKVRAPEGYARAYERRRRSLRALPGAYADGETRLYVIELIGRAVVGIGAASVRETNLCLLRPWGVPYIPGSSLKGVAAHEAHGRGEGWQKPAKPGDAAGLWHQALFGDVSESGAVIFHDAWWCPNGDRVPVAQDTTTVHHKEYYEGTAGPCDWDEPTPVGLLTSSGSYLLAMTGPPAALEIVEPLLRDALAHRGVGAKTSSGYGRGRLVRETSPLARELSGFAMKPVQPNTITAVADQLARLLERVSFRDEERAAELVIDGLLKASRTVWKDWLARDTTDTDGTRARLRPWFARALAGGAPVVAQASTKATAPAVEATPDRRAVRVFFVPKDAKRFELRVEGDKKTYKSHVLRLGDGVEAALRAHPTDGVVLDVAFENGKPTKLDLPR